MLRTPSICHSALFGLLALAGGCASVDDSGYPSLERRAAELRGNPAPAPAPAPPPPPVTVAFAQAVAALNADAARGEAAFRAALPAANRMIMAARGSAVASEPWFAAQAALSALEQQRAPTLLALTEIDRLLLEAELAADANRTAPLAQLARTVAAQEAAQTAELNRLGGLLAR
jgi:hypothetical protein